MVKSRTVNDVRIFCCRVCGNEIEEPIKWWEKKPQKMKNVCTHCIQERQLAKEDAREMVSFTELLQRYGFKSIQKQPALLSKLRCKNGFRRG